MNRAYSTLELKAVDEDSRRFAGVASTPEVDRVGDIVEPAGAEYKLPLPLLWMHNSADPVGWVRKANITPTGIEVEGEIANVKEDGPLKLHLADAWQKIKSKLVRGLSIGFSDIESEPIKGTMGRRFLKWEWLELSAVTIPANMEATITAIKAIDREVLGKTLKDVEPSRKTPAERLKAVRENFDRAVEAQGNHARSPQDKAFVAAWEVIQKDIEGKLAPIMERLDKLEARKPGPQPSALQMLGQKIKTGENRETSILDLISANNRLIHEADADLEKAQAEIAELKKAVEEIRAGGFKFTGVFQRAMLSDYKKGHVATHLSSMWVCVSEPPPGRARELPGLAVMPERKTTMIKIPKTDTEKEVARERFRKLAQAAIEAGKEIVSIEAVRAPNGICVMGCDLNGDEICSVTIPESGQPLAQIENDFLFAYQVAAAFAKA